MMERVYCKEHNQTAGSFCEDCLVGVCWKCYPCHDGHHIFMVEKLFPKYQNLIKTDIIPGLQRKISEMSQLKERLIVRSAKEMEQKRREMCRKFDSAIHAMKDKKMMALDILGKIERGNRYQQSCSAQYLQGLSEMMERASKYKNNRSTPLDYADLKKKIGDLVDNFNKQKIRDRLPLVEDLFDAVEIGTQKVIHASNTMDLCRFEPVFTITATYFDEKVDNVGSRKHKFKDADSYNSDPQPKPKYLRYDIESASSSINKNSDRSSVISAESNKHDDSGRLSVRVSQEFSEENRSVPTSEKSSGDRCNVTDEREKGSDIVEWLVLDSTSCDTACSNSGSQSSYHNKSEHKGFNLNSAGRGERLNQRKVHDSERRPEKEPYDGRIKADKDCHAEHLPVHKKKHKQMVNERNEGVKGEIKGQRQGNIQRSLSDRFGSLTSAAMISCLDDGLKISTEVNRPERGGNLPRFPKDHETFKTSTSIENVASNKDCNNNTTDETQTNKCKLQPFRVTVGNEYHCKDQREIMNQKVKRGNNSSKSKGGITKEMEWKHDMYSDSSLSESSDDNALMIDEDCSGIAEVVKKRKDDDKNANSLLDFPPAEHNFYSKAQSTIVIKNLPHKLSKSLVNEIVSDFGQINNLWLTHQHDNNYGIIQYNCISDASRAVVVMHNQVIMGSQLDVSFLGDFPECGTRLNVHRIPLFWKTEDLYKAFAKFGSLLHAKVLICGKNKRTLTGFLIFAEKSDAETALSSMNNFQPIGSKLSFSINYETSIDKARLENTTKDSAEKKRHVLKKLLDHNKQNCGEATSFTGRVTSVKKGSKLTANLQEHVSAVDCKNSLKPEGKPNHKPMQAASSGIGKCKAMGTKQETGCKGNQAEFYSGKKTKEKVLSIKHEENMTFPLNRSRLVINNLPMCMSETQLQETFIEYGVITALAIHSNEDGSRYGIMQYENSLDAAIAMIKQHRMEHHGKLLQVAYDNHEECKVGGRIYVRNISLKWTSTDLTYAFAKYGTLIEAFVVRRHGGCHLGIGVVIYNDVASAENAVKHMNGYKHGVNNLPMNVVHASLDCRSENKPIDNVGDTVEQYATEGLVTTGVTCRKSDITGADAKKLRKELICSDSSDTTLKTNKLDNKCLIYNEEQLSCRDNQKHGNIVNQQQTEDVDLRQKTPSKYGLDNQNKTSFVQSHELDINQNFTTTKHSYSDLLASQSNPGLQCSDSNSNTHGLHVESKNVSLTNVSINYNVRNNNNQVYVPLPAFRNPLYNHTPSTEAVRKFCSLTLVNFCSLDSDRVIHTAKLVGTPVELYVSDTDQRYGLHVGYGKGFLTMASPSQAHAFLELTKRSGLYNAFGHRIIVIPCW